MTERTESALKESFMSLWGGMYSLRWDNTGMMQYRIYGLEWQDITQKSILHALVDTLKETREELKTSRKQLEESKRAPIWAAGGGYDG